MSAVFGFSIGADAVRIVRIDDESSTSRDRAQDDSTGDTRFLSRVLGATAASPPRVAASAAVDLERLTNAPIVVACPDERLRISVEAEFAASNVTDFRLISDAEAVLELVNASGAVHGFRNLLVYDLGKTGLTVSIIDVATGLTQGSTRTIMVSGDMLDRLVGEHLKRRSRDSVGPIGSERSVGERDWVEFGLVVKHSLSSALEYRDSDSTVMTRFEFDELARDPIVSSWTAINEVALQAQRRPDVVAMVGGGARIPLLEELLRELRIPVIRPAEPELAAGKGAALWARNRELRTREIPIVRVVPESPVGLESKVDIPAVDVPEMEVIDADVSHSDAADADTEWSDDVAAVEATSNSGSAAEDRDARSGRSRIPYVVGAAMTVIAASSIFLWGVLRPFADPEVAQASDVQTSESSVTSSPPAPATTPSQVADPLTARQSAQSELVRRWKY